MSVALCSTETLWSGVEYGCDTVGGSQEYNLTANTFFSCSHSMPTGRDYLQLSVWVLKIPAE